MEQKPNIGKTLSPEENLRDAIHCAIAPVVAAIDLYPAQHVGLNEDGQAGVVQNAIGIVDPFLKNKVFKGESFYLFLYPNTITSLKHSWTHPAFEKEVLTPKVANPPPKTDKDASIEWLKNYAVSEVYDSDYYSDRDKAYEAMLSQVRNNELIFHGQDCHGYGDVPDAEELFRHLSVVLGQTIDRAYFEDNGYFSCSC